jgi:exopolyphosphatase/pppGpp-phosphohydrolase
LAARRALPHIRPQRADILAAGLIIVDTACTLLAIDELQVQHADLLAGYSGSALYRAVAAPAPCDGAPQR